MISIILPIYNVKDYLKNCLDSILAQTYNNYEVLLIDDGSTDGCSDVCDFYCKKDGRFRTYHQKNQGLVAAWKKGVELSSGEYIAFIDPDDWISRKYLENMINHLPNDIVLTKYISELPDGKCLTSKLQIDAKQYGKEEIRKEIYPIALNAGGFQQRGFPMCRWGKIIRRELIEKNIHYCSNKATYAEDVNIIFPVLLDATNIYVVDDPECIYYYRVNYNSMLHKYNPKLLESIRTVHSSLIRICNEKYHQEMISQVYADFLSAAVQDYKNELINPHGLSETKRKINEIVNTDLFQKAVNQTKWENYDNLNKLIIWSMKNNGSVLSNLNMVLLRILRNYRISAYLKKSKI